MPCEPGLRRILLTRWAMAIATRVVAVPDSGTGRAGGDVAAEGGSPALRNRRHRLPVAGQQAVAPLLVVGWRVAPKDVGNGYPITPSMT